MTYQPSFFDESERLEALAKLGDPLIELDALIDFEVLFRAELEKAFAKPEAKGPGGRPSYDVVMMFKMLILQRLYNLSDEQLEFQVTDRLSFTRFLRIALGENVPDFSTVWRFREALSQGDRVRNLFDVFTETLDALGILARKGSIIDATFVEVPRQRNSRSENELIKEGEVPKDWQKSPRKLAQKDLDARWTKKNQETFYGYKDHIKTDSGTVLITDYVVTAANVHDIEAGWQLVGKEDAGTTIHADSAYKSKAMDEKLAALKIENRIHEKGHRGAKLTQEQMDHNRQKSKVRALVEHVFAYMENSMNWIYLRCVGLRRAKAQIGLANLTYNLCRYVQLIRLGRVKWAC